MILFVICCILASLSKLSETPVHLSYHQDGNSYKFEEVKCVSVVLPTSHMLVGQRM